MNMKMKIITSNSHFDADGKEDGGFNEIYEIGPAIFSVPRTIAFVQSIITNNLVFACKDTTLVDVTVQIPDSELQDEVMLYFQRYPLFDGVAVYVERLDE